MGHMTDQQLAFAMRKQDVQAQAALHNAAYRLQQGATTIATVPPGLQPTPVHVVDGQSGSEIDTQRAFQPFRATRRGQARVSPTDATDPNQPINLPEPPTPSPCP